MTGKRCPVALLIVVMAATVCGCGPKQEFLAGAEDMNDEQKMEQVEKYCEAWAKSLEGSLEAKNLETFPASFNGLRPDGQCDIELNELNDILASKLQGIKRLMLLPQGPGEVRVKVKYQLPAGGDVGKARFEVTFVAMIGAEIAHVSKKRPDPRIFSIFLKDAK